MAGWLNRLGLNRLLLRLTSARGLALCFLLFGLPTGLSCALLSPVGMFPDEFAHAARADGLRHGEIFGQKQPAGRPFCVINAGVKIDLGIYAVLFSREYPGSVPDRPVQPQARRDVESLPWFPGAAYFPTQMVAYFPIMYVPGAVGLLAGQSFGLSPLHTYFLGRVAMLLVYLALGAAAIVLARFGNGLIFAVLTLPAAIDLASSYNQDGLIIVCCALAAALLSRCRPGLSRRWFVALALLTAVVCAKTPYAALLLLCLPPLLATGFWRRGVIVLLACVLPGLWLLHVVHLGFMPYQRAPYHPGPLWPGAAGITLHDIQPRYNVSVLLAHPWQIVMLPVRSFVMFWSNNWPRMLGVVAGDTLLISAWEFPLLAVALLAAALAAAIPSSEKSGDENWRGVDVGFAALAVFAAFTGMEIAMYLTFTPAGKDWVEGIQSRYFLPLLPFFIFLLPAVGRWLRLGKMRHFRACLCLPSVAMAAVNSYALPSFIFHIFRMAGP